MALEVNEIGIRMRIYGDSNEETPVSRAEEGDSVAQKRAEIVAACVRQVLRILKAMEER